MGTAPSPEIYSVNGGNDSSGRGNNNNSNNNNIGNTNESLFTGKILPAIRIIACVVILILILLISSSSVKISPASSTSVNQQSAFLNERLRTTFGITRSESLSDGTSSVDLRHSKASSNGDGSSDRSTNSNNSMGESWHWSTNSSGSGDGSNSNGDSSHNNSIATSWPDSKNSIKSDQSLVLPQSTTSSTGSSGGGGGGGGDGPLAAQLNHDGPMPEFTGVRVGIPLGDDNGGGGNEWNTSITNESNNFTKTSTDTLTNSETMFTSNLWDTLKSLLTKSI